MNVRVLIRLWHTLEFLTLFFVWNAITDSKLWAIFDVTITMLLLRLFLIGALAVVTGLVVNQRVQSIRQFMLLWFGEFRAFCVMYFWFQLIPRRWLSKSDQPSNRHVILAHGFLCNDGFWVKLKPKLQRNGYSVSTVEMPNAFASIDHYGALIEHEINQLKQVNPNVSITLVAFSMGGLASAKISKELQENTNLITLYTPHQGTALANLTGFFGVPNGRQMSLNSDWTQSITPENLSFKHSVGFWSAHDTIVLPAKQGLPPFNGVLLAGKGHLNASLDSELHDQVLYRLNGFYDGQSAVSNVSSNSDSNSSLKHSMID